MILSAKDVKKEIDQIKNSLVFSSGEGRDISVVFANGVFDILHVGHIRYLIDAKKHGDILVVGINSDRSVEEYKGKAPYTYELNRAEIIDSLRCVRFVTIFDESTPADIMRIIKPDFHAKGTDYTEAPEKEVLEEIGAQFIICGDPKNNSSSVIRKHLEN